MLDSFSSLCILGISFLLDVYLATILSHCVDFCLLCFLCYTEAFFGFVRFCLSVVINSQVSGVLFRKSSPGLSCRIFSVLSSSSLKVSGFIMLSIHLKLFCTVWQIQIWFHSSTWEHSFQALFIKDAIFPFLLYIYQISGGCNYACLRLGLLFCSINLDAYFSGILCCFYYYTI